MPPKSNFWQYFEKGEDKNTAVCRFCNKKIKTSGNTSNLKCHIESMHKGVSIKTSIKTVTNSQATLVSGRQVSAVSDPTVVASRSIISDEPDSDADSTGTIERVSLQADEDQDYETDSTQCSSSFKRQKTINETFSFIKAHATGGKQYTKITDALLFMICHDYQPINIVENEGFVQLMHTICPLYKLPSRKTVTALIDKKYEAVSNMFRDKIKKANSLTLTCYIWTKTMNSRSFLGVTVHFLEGNGILDATLGIYELSERHTAEYIADCLKNMCKEWKITEEKIMCVVTDGAANMIKAIDLAFGKRKHIICFAHLLNLIVTKALEQVVELTGIIKKVKDIVRWFKQSVVASDLLRKAQKEEDPPLLLKQDVITRWNSTYYMLERFLKLRVHVNTIVNTEVSAPPMLSAIEMRELEAVINLLQPFEYATKEISASKYTTGSIIIPLVRNVHRCLERTEVGDFPLATSLKSNLIKEVDRRMGSVDQTTLLAAATLIDPRFKKMYFSNPIYCAKAVEFIQNSVKNKLQNAAHSEETGENEPEIESGE